MNEPNNLAKRLMTLPNKLTLARVLVVPILLILYPFDREFINYLCALLFGAAALTDFFDGYLARKYQTESVLGAIFDHIADKILVTATILILISAARLPTFIGVLLLCREFAVSGIRESAHNHGFTIKVNSFGKVKTAIQDVALFCLLAGVEPLLTVGMIAIWGGLGLSYYSGYVYWREFWDKLSAKGLTDEAPPS